MYSQAELLKLAMQDVFVYCQIQSDCVSDHFQILRFVLSFLHPSFYKLKDNLSIRILC